MALMVELVNQGFDNEAAKKTADFALDTLSDRELISGSASRRDVMTKELVIQGSANRISGFVLERITIEGSANRIEIVAPVGVKVEEYGSANRIQIQRLSTEDFANALMNKIKMNPPKEPPTLEEFREWVDLVNMKNKELKAFMDSDWFAVSGLTPKQTKEQGIKSGQDSSEQSFA